MAGRRRQRETALQLAYAIEMTGDEFPDAHFRFMAHEPRRQKGWGDFAQNLLVEMLKRREEIDARLSLALQHWRLERLSTIDRTILRLAVCEFMAFEDIPLRATINEFIDLAHAYGNDESPPFINGILDAIARDYPQKDFEAPPEPPEEEAAEDEAP